MEVCVLGPLLLQVDATSLPLRGSRRRALVAYLAVSGSEVRSINRICDDLWDGHPSIGAAGTVKTYVSQLRKVAAEHGVRRVVETTPAGYRLDGEEVTVDASVFEASLRAASATSEPESRLRLLTQALDLWRGEALTEFRSWPWADSEGRRLDRLRTAARVAHAQALMDVGRHHDAVAALSQVRDEQPFDEHVATLLATALYRSGQVGGALRALADLRLGLREELGLEPGPGVGELESQILNHSPSLAALPPRPVAPAPSAPDSALVGSTLPTGLLTFLFVDIEGSTRILQNLGEARYGDVLSDYRRLVRDAYSRHRGIEFGTEGDALFVAFRRASDAVAAASRAQRSLARHAWPTNGHVRARMGLHTGEAEVVSDDYVGLALHVAARVCAAASGDQVLLTGATRGLIDGVPVRPLGEHQLREVAHPVSLYQLLVVGAANNPRAPRTATARPDNIPLAVDEFVGRGPELDLLRHLLADHRLVTLSGPGGAGKTRLALEAATESIGRYADGVWLIELAEETDQSRTAAAVAGVLGLGEARNIPMQRALLEWLKTRDLLLVMDNCEHVLEGVRALTVSILRQCPGVRVLATSRERLNVRGEHVLAVPPLPLEHDAPHLFTVRARAVAPDICVDDGDRLSRVCRRLDGLPLAIELAAARLSGLSLADLDDRLDDRFRLLNEGPQTDQRRHQTLEAVVAWSYDLLDERDQTLFDRCATFVADFSAEAAVAVAATPPLSAPDVLDGLIRLVDKSLLTRLVERDGRTRYQMLETLRRYGEFRLQETESVGQANEQLVAWALERAALLERCMRTPDQDAALRAADPDRANLRRAMEMALEQDNHQAALRIVSAVPVGPVVERLAMIRRLLPQAQHLPRVVAQALLTSCNLAFEQGDWSAAIRDGRDAARSFLNLGEDRLAAWARFIEAFSRWGAGDDDGADAVLSEVISTFRALGDELGLGYALWFASQREHNPAIADRLAAEAEGLLRALGGSVALAHNLEGRALIAIRQGDQDRAAGQLAEALRRFADAGNIGCTAHCLEAIAALLVLRGDDLAHVAHIAGAAEGLRNACGQQHRPWELYGSQAVQQRLRQVASTEEIEVARRQGTELDLATAVERAAVLLAR